MNLTLTFLVLTITICCANVVKRIDFDNNSAISTTNRFNNEINHLKIGAIELARPVKPSKPIEPIKPVEPIRPIEPIKPVKPDEETNHRRTPWVNSYDSSKSFTANIWLALMVLLIYSSINLRNLLLSL